MKFSEEQNDIFDFAENGLPNLIVQAVAGAGKTTTLVECANRIDSNKKILLLHTSFIGSWLYMQFSMWL